MISLQFAKASFFGNSHIGLFVCASERFVFYPKGASARFVESLRVLACEKVCLSICESELLGLYMCANSRGVVVPKDSTKEEREALQRLGLAVYALKDKRNAVGNNICANDYGAVVNRNIPLGEVRNIEECFGVKAVRATLAGFEAVGSLCTATNKGFLASPDINEKEMKLLEEALGVKGACGTANMGVGFVKLALCANSHGCLCGERTSGFEMGAIQQAFGD